MLTARVLVMPITNKGKTNLKELRELFNEAVHFEDFILSTLKKEEGAIDGETYQKSHGIKGYYCDGFLPKGIKGITSEPSLLEICYFPLKNDIKSILDRQKIINTEGKTIVIVCPLSDKEINEIAKLWKHNTCILGIKYLRKLIMNNPLEWLIFSASCSKDNVAVYNEATETCTIKNRSLVGRLLGIEVSFSKDNIHDLSLISAALFKNKIKKQGNPALFIGNGASIHFGSDLWAPLCTSLFDYLTPKYISNADSVKKTIGNSTFSMSSMTKYLIDKDKYYFAIYSSIYRKYEEDMHTENTLIRAAVQAKIKNPNMPIVTYNYDNFFERDYEKVTNKKIKSVINRSSNLRSSEPKILHVHGFFPLRKNGSKAKPNLVLTQEEYYSAYVSRGWTPSIQKKILTENTCLFIGSSMSDLYQMSMIDEVQKDYYSKANDSIEFKTLTPWKCFALVCLKDMDTRDIVSLYNFYISKGVYIIFVDKFKDLPKELSKLFR